MKKILPAIGLSVILLSTDSIQAQDVSINITPQTFPMLEQATGLLRVAICNNHPTNVTAPANKLRPQISFPDNLTIIDALNTDGTPITNFTVQSLVNVDGDHTIRLLYNGTLAQFDCIEFDVRVFGESVGTGPITCTLGFQGPPTVGNNPANDNSTATMPVEINLPVKLREFQVDKEGSTAVLQWITTEEVNSERFDVQRSGDGKTWQVIESVNALGDSKEGKTYTTSDTQPLSGENLYRLHMIDRDGTSAYSSIRNLHFEALNSFMYPNPVSDKLTIKVKDASQLLRVSVLDANGKEVYNSGEKPQSTIDVSRLQPGMYVVKVKSVNGEETSSKVVVVR